MRIFLSHNYGRRRGLSEEECEANVLKSIEYERALTLMGHNVYNPLHYHWVHKGWSESLDEELWHNKGSSWLIVCEALFVATEPMGENWGVAREIRLAKALRMPIYYDLKEVPSA